MENFLTFPVNEQSFQVLVLCHAATNACHLIHGICLNHRETFLAIHALCSIHHRHFVKEFFTLRLQVLQVPFQCKEVQGNLSREVKKGSTTTVPISERRPPTMNSFCQWEIPQNSMPGQQRVQSSELQFDKFPTPSKFMYLKIRFNTQVSSCSDFPSDAMSWIKEVDMVDSVD